MSDLSKIKFEFKRWTISSDDAESNSEKLIAPDSHNIIRTDIANQLSFFDNKFYLGKLNSNQLQEISLVLASQDIDHWTFFHKNNWMIFINENWVIVAEGILKTYVRENRRTKNILPNLELKLSPFIILIVPILFYFWSMADIFDSWGIRQAGKSVASKILDGQWWRAITALTLHADIKHIMSNFISGYFILNLLFSRRNPIKSGGVVLIAAIVANFLVAFTMKENFSSLGFSTYVFSALGSLAFVEAIEASKNDIQLNYWRKLQPLYSAFLIAVMLGISENSDILAHFYGFFMGVVMAALFLRDNNDKLFIKFQLVILVAIYALFAISWDFAYFRVIS